MNQGREKIKSFTDLRAWQKGHSLVLSIYQITKSFPREETYGLTDQMRRSAISITSNLAEGFSRQSYKEKVQFYSIAQGSVTELQSQLLVARDIALIRKASFEDLAHNITDVHKLISGLIKASKAVILDS